LAGTAKRRSAFPNLFYPQDNLEDLVKSQKYPSPFTGEGQGEGEQSRNFNKLFIPLPSIPSRQGRGNNSFYETINFDDLVKSLKRRISVIPAKAGIKLFQILKNSLDSGFHRSDDFLR